MPGLQNSVVLVKSYKVSQDEKPDKIGTGFFIDEEGSILTCFHVVGDQKTYKLHEKITMTFIGEERQVECVETVNEPNGLDLAILRAPGWHSPEEMALLPVGDWSGPDGRFRSFGFSLSDTFEGIFAEGQIIGRVRPLSFKIELLQLTAQAVGTENIQEGMSGAPIYDETNGMIVGMINVLYKARGSHMPFAIPIEYIAGKVAFLKARLDETRLLHELQKIICNPKWFPQNSFEAFYKGAPILGLLAYDAFGEEKRYKEIVEQFRGKKQRLFEFICYLLDKRADIESPLLEHTHRVKFINRELERKEACDIFAPPYILFEGPAGYGKTELLHAIQCKQFQEGWVCLYLEIPDTPAVSALSLAQLMAEQVDYGKGVEHLPSLEAIGFVLGGHLQRYFPFEGGNEVGLVLLVDGIERLPESEIHGFVNQFLPAFQNTLSHVKIRMRFAGRSVGSLWARNSAKLPLKILPLSPFRFKYVQETVRRLLPNCSDHDSFAAHLMSITGGHPGCMAEIIEKAKVNAQTPEVFFNSEETVHKQIILKYANQIRDEIPENLRAIFDILSVFRRFNLRVLDKILSEKLIDYPYDALSLERELTATYLVKRRHGFIQDEIVRRLLVLRLRWENPQLLTELYTKARDIYYQDLVRPFSREEDYVALECLFTELMVYFYQHDNSYANRTALKNDFFTQNGILNKYLSITKNKPDADEIKQNLLQLLNDENGEGDWEFRFVLNFFMREEKFTAQPYEELLKQIQTFK